MPPGDKIYLYLQRVPSIERANQVWAAAIACLPIGPGFLYLVAMIDWGAAQFWPHLRGTALIFQYQQ